MTDFVVGSAAVHIKPVFPNFQKNISKELGTALPKEGAKAGQQAGTAASAGMAQGMRKGATAVTGAAKAATAGAAAAASTSGTTAGAGLVSRMAASIRSGAAAVRTAVTGASASAAGAGGAAGTATGTSFVSRMATTVRGGAAAVTGAVGRTLSGAAALGAAAGTATGGSFVGSMTRALGPLAAIFAPAAVIGGGFNRLANIEDAQAKLTGLGHSAETVEEVMNNALESVKGTAFGLDEAAGVASGLIASGIQPGEELQSVLANVGDAATIAGTSMGEMGAIYNKIAAGGRIQGEELAQLGDRGIPILQLLSEHLGVSVEDVRKLASEGKIGFDDFAAAMDAGLGGAAQKSGETTRGTLRNVGAAVSRLGATIMEEIFPKIKEWGALAIEVIDETIIPAFKNAVNWIKENADTLKNLASVAAGAVAVFMTYRGVMMGINAVLRVSQITMAAIRAGQLIWIGVTKGLTAATTAHTAAVAANNTAMRLNPIGLLITALLALGAALVLAYNKSETFRNMVDTAWEAIKNAISVAWEQWIKPVFESIKTWINETLIPLFQRFYHGVILPVWSAIQTAISWAWNNIIKPIFAGIKWYIQNVLGPIFNWLYNNVILPVWDWIQWKIDVVWNVIKLIFDTIRWVIKNVVGPTFTWLRDEVIGPVWDWISEKISTIWEDNIKPVLETIGDFIEDTVAPGIRRGAEIIGNIWNSVRDMFARPINWVIDNVWNGGIKEVFDNVAEAIGSDARLPAGPRIPLSTDAGPEQQISHGKGSYTARKTGGYTNPGLTLVGEEGPEFIQLHRPARVYNAAQTRAMAHEAPHGAGFFESVGHGLKNALYAPLRGIKKVVDWTRGGLATAAGWVLDPIFDSLSDVSFLQNPFGELVTGAATNAKDQLLEWIRGKDDETIPSAGNTPQAGDPGRRLIPGARGYVNRAGWALADQVGGLQMLQTINRSMAGGHRTGKAIDFWDSVSKLNDLADVIVRTNGYGNFRYMAWQGRMWSPGIGWRSQGRGYGSDPQHRRHLHAEWYDSGGVLPPGITTALNATGKPEAILTNEQWRDVSVLAQRGAAAFPDEVYLNVDGERFKAYVETRADSRIAAGKRRAQRA